MEKVKTVMAVAAFETGGWKLEPAIEENIWVLTGPDGEFRPLGSGDIAAVNKLTGAALRHERKAAEAKAGE